MKVAVACDGEQVSPHFGRCEHYLIAELQDGEIQLSEWFGNPGHAPGALPALMREKGVDCMLAGGAGPRAVGLLAEAGIELVVGVSGDALAALQALSQGVLAGGESACEH